MHTWPHGQPVQAYMDLPPTDFSHRSQGKQGQVLQTKPCIDAKDSQGSKKSSISQAKEPHPTKTLSRDPCYFPGNLSWGRPNNRLMYSHNEVARRAGGNRPMIHCNDPCGCMGEKIPQTWSHIPTDRCHKPGGLKPREAKWLASSFSAYTFSELWASFSPLLPILMGVEDIQAERHDNHYSHCWLDKTINVWFCHHHQHCCP